MADLNPLKMSNFPGWDATVATVSECDATSAKITFNVGTQFKKGQRLILLKPKEEDSKLISTSAETQSKSASSESEPEPDYESFFSNVDEALILSSRCNVFNYVASFDCKIAKVLVKKGDIVKRGQPILKYILERNVRWKPLSASLSGSALIVDMMVNDGEDVKENQPFFTYKFMEAMPMVNEVEKAPYDVYGLVWDKETGLWTCSEPCGDWCCNWKSKS